MNRDETIALWERCEAARAEAKARALAEGKDEDDARNIAHDAAKAVWNGWAEDMLAERKALEETGDWAAEKGFLSDLEPKNDQTKDWLNRASADFNRCRFVANSSLRGADAPKQSTGSEDTELDRRGADAPRDEEEISISLADAYIDFRDFIFPGTASFASARFSGTASFDCARFSGDAWFASTRFSGDAWFASARFSGRAWFDNARFSGYAWFASARFSGRASFGSARFSGYASFTRAKFEGFAGFDSARFDGPASFNAVRGDRAFSLADATFEQVPDFIQAHFEEAPRLDNVTVSRRLIRAFPDYPPRKDDDGAAIPPEFGERAGHMLDRLVSWPSRVVRWMQGADGDAPACWRALKRLAVQAHDQDREHAFFAGEVRSARFATDWPLPFERGKLKIEAPSWRWLNHVPFVFWRGEAWLGFFSFWFGVLYGLFSNFGRSVARPFLWWALGVVVSTMLYLGEHPGMSGERARAEQNGATFPYVATTLEAWREGRDCYAPDFDPAKTGAGEATVRGLSPELRGQTSAFDEAFNLAIRDGFLILYGDADTAHRIYGCLYGVEVYAGSSPVAIVPPSVSTVSAIQKIWSAIMIFLFGLALRNMLKKK